MKLAPNSDAAASFGTPISTNANGLRAWVLDASQLRAFVEPFDARTGKIGSTSYAIVFDGQQANRTQISSIVPVNGTNDFINLVTSFVPKIVSGSVQLTVGITWIGGNITPSNANLVACRALLPNNGALVIDCGSAKAADGKNYWFIFCPIIQEPNAKPRKR